ncbi:MAG TPA: hypothetical protein VJ836_05855 [Candidatus Saccharimonadales bacterium]|nr:hypothetical protein [Candidatus Saccharimonadales bacterium]
MSAPIQGGKDVIYVDVDDEITAIIDKVRGSHQKIVALVLPKRATMFQSVVNMKLLKRSAEASKKNVVLITSEPGLMPLAGNVGLYVAKSLQTKPEVPDAPARVEEDVEPIDEDMPDTAVDKTKTVGELTGGATAADSSEDTIELDDETEEPNTSPNAKSSPVKGANKKLKVPDFNKFRLLLLLAGMGVVVLGLVGYVAAVVMPRASVLVKTNSSAVNSDTELTLKTTPGIKLDVDKGVVPAGIKEVKKTLSQQVEATGQQNNGTKSTGTMKFYNCNKDDTLEGNNHTVPAGTAVSANGKTFITAQAVEVAPSNFVGSNCLKNKLSATITITAIAPGASYNQASTTYAVAGYSTITGNGSETTGGADNITKVVTQGDIDSAKQKIGAQDTESVKQQLKTDLINAGYYAIDGTFNSITPETKSNVNAGDAAPSVTVTQTLTYTMQGVKKNDLEKVITNDVNAKIDPKKESILDYGIDKANFNLQTQQADGAVIAMHTTVIAGPELNVDELKKQIAGKKANDAKEIIKENPGVTDVTVEYSPFWVSSIPKDAKKIQLVIEKPKTSDVKKEE